MLDYKQLLVIVSFAALFIGCSVIGEGRKIAFFTIRRWHLAIALGLLVLFAGALPLQRLPHYLDLDVLLFVYLMSLVTGYLEVSGAAELVARKVSRLGGFKAVFGMLMAAGGLSLILENVSVVYLFAPLALRMANAAGIDPVTVVIGVALAADMAGSATMIGDPPAIITAGYLHLNFMDFIVYRGRPSMFFYTVAAMIASCALISFMAGKGARPVEDRSDLKIDRVFLAEVLAFLTIKIILLSLRDRLEIPLTLTALIAIGGVTLCRLLRGDMRSVREAFSKHDYETPLFLAGVFMLSGAFVETRLADQVVSFLLQVSQGDIPRLTLLIIAVSMLVSAVLYNTPYIVAMLPVVTDLASKIGFDPVPLAWALLIGATLGGTLTYIGAMGNYAAVRFLAIRGYPVGFKRFAKVSVPFTLVSVAVGTSLYALSWWWKT